MGNLVVNYAKKSQALLASGMIICVVLRPEFFFSLDQGGVSNYGTLPITVFPYSVALLGCAYYMARSAQLLPRHNQRLVDANRIIHIVSMFFLILLFSTYTYQYSLLLTYVHQIISIMAIIILLLAGLWMYRYIPRSGQTPNYYALALMIGVMLGFLTVIDIVRLLFTSQMLVAIGFGGLYMGFMKYLSLNLSEK